SFNDVIRVGDLDVPKGIEVLTEPERAVASVQPPRTEQELEALEEAIEEAEEVEITTEKKEEAEGIEAKAEAEEAKKKEEEGEKKEGKKAE
ncbi:hypothetical protein IH979_03660, partial [Patescibacteria group bacterium]|nr:hypothetical protein [Patescibacteria group bacterium]